MSEPTSTTEATVVEPTAGPVFEPYDRPLADGVRCRPRRVRCASKASR